MLSSGRKDALYVMLGYDFGYAKASAYYEVNSLADASKAVRQYIDRHDLGSSTWAGGRVINDKFEFVAQISYNGRIWDNEIWEHAKEIKL